MDLRASIIENLRAQSLSFWGERDEAYLGRVADDWLDISGRRCGSLYRLEKIGMLLEKPSRILDMGAGCGTFVRFALKNGYDVYGIEPEGWKLEIASHAVTEFGLDPLWRSRIIAAVGEKLPFDDNTFDCVTTFQTLEHVQDVSACCSEMLRVTREGGCIYIRCPDYSLSTHEGHYRIAWFPKLWGRAAEQYLSLVGKPLAGVRSLQPVSGRMVRRIFSQLEAKTGALIHCINVDELRCRRLLRLPPTLFGTILTRPFFVAQFVRLLMLRREYPVHLAVMVRKKSL